MVMKRKITLILVASIAVYGCRSHYPVVTNELVVPNTTADLERGKNLTFNVCGQCHYNKDYKSFIGEEMRDLPGIMGTVYSANLTHGHIVDRYTDNQLFYLIKTGIARDGHYIPWMIRPTIADQDLKDIIAYLRSDDEPIKENKTDLGKTHLSWVAKQGLKFMKPQPLHLNEPLPESNPVSQGRYLVDIIGCYHCHSKSMFGLNYGNPEDSKGYMAGGMSFKVDGKKVYASNLTPDKGTGIGNYTESEFRRAVKEGIAKSGRKINYPMRHFKHLTDEQADAIFAYIQTLQPVNNKVRGH
jgi:mono/diheme cytochrome c family protein